MKLKLKEFLLDTRNIELEQAFIVVNDNISPYLFGYLTELHNIEFKDGSYHTFCGELKSCVNNFIGFWMDKINDVVRQVDQYTNIITKDELVALVDQSINIHLAKHSNFIKEYLPVESRAEQEALIAVEKQFPIFMNDLYAMREKLSRFETQKQLINFAKNHFEISMQKKTAILEFTHKYISYMLADKLKEIRISLEETLGRVRTNLQERRDEQNDMYNGWLLELYDKNKERLFIARQERKHSADEAEVELAITRIREKIEDYQQNTAILRLQNEVAYWETRLEDFRRIEKTLLTLKTENENLNKQENIYNSYKCLELPGSKLQAWKNIGENLKQRQIFVNNKYLDAARALLTFFAVRGLNRINYKDHIGTYILDEFGHQVYIFDHGKKSYHRSCDGAFKQYKETDKYYYDNNGRYLLDKRREKVYQCAPCTSTYKLGDNDLLIKTTQDCGHSDKVRKTCKTELKDPTDVEILPIVANIEIQGTLSREVVDYLWNCFGQILHEALRDVVARRTNNPIHRLAHGLIFNKYCKTLSKVNEEHKSAEVYRANIYKKRIDKSVADSKAWKAKQVKRRKPEEFDDTQERAVYDAHISGYNFIQALENFN